MEIKQWIKDKAQSITQGNYIPAIGETMDKGNKYAHFHTMSVRLDIVNKYNSWEEFLQGILSGEAKDMV